MYIYYKLYFPYFQRLKAVWFILWYLFTKKSLLATYTFSFPVSHTYAQHSHFIKQLTVHDSTKQKPKWTALIGSGQIP